MCFKYSIGVCALLFIWQTLTASNTKEFGDFKLKITDYAVETNEKLKEYFYAEIKFIPYNDTLSLQTYGKVTKNLGVMGIKFRCFKWNEKTQSYISSFTMGTKNMCQRQMSKQLLSLIPGTVQDCSIKVGEYNITVTDLSEKVRLVSNGKFFYGKYQAVSEIFAGKYGRLMRFNFSGIVSPA